MAMCYVSSYTYNVATLNLLGPTPIMVAASISIDTDIFAIMIFWQVHV